MLTIEISSAVNVMPKAHLIKKASPLQRKPFLNDAVYQYPGFCFKFGFNAIADCGIGKSSFSSVGVVLYRPCFLPSPVGPGAGLITGS